MTHSIANRDALWALDWIKKMWLLCGDCQRQLLVNSISRNGKQLGRVNIEFFIIINIMRGRLSDEFHKFTYII